MNYWAEAKKVQKEAPEDDLVRRHLYLALTLANKLHYADFDVEERLAVANLALCEAAKEYRGSRAERRGISFNRFATLRIRSAITEAREQNRRAGVRVPREKRFKIRDAMDVSKTLSRRLGRRPTAAEIAKELGWTERLVKELQLLAGTAEALSLDQRIPGFEEGEPESTFAHNMADETVDVEADVLDRVQNEDDARKLREAVNGLPPMLRTALSLRTGFRVPACETLTLEQVLSVATNVGSQTTVGLQRLRREGVADELRPGRVVQDRGGDSSLFGFAPSSPKAEDRKHSAADFWNRLARDGRFPSVVAADAERTGTVRPSA